MLRLGAIVFIYLCTTAAWLILAGTIFSRTDNSTGSLGEKVQTSWGAPQTQFPPRAMSRSESEHQSLDPESSKIETSLALEHRQKGLLWYSTYKVDFAGAYVFHNAAAEERNIDLEFDFPGVKAIYDDLQVTLDGKPLETSSTKNGLAATTVLPPGAAATLRIAYRSQGLSTWSYHFGKDVSQVHNFTLLMHTNFKDIDFPENSLSPSRKLERSDGWDLTWEYKNLVSGYQIAMTLPEKLQPGPLAGAVSLFAPVSLLFFFFVMVVITTLRKIELHPINYFFLAAAFFAFHLLMAYLVDHISIHVAFAICSMVSIALVVSYLRLVVGLRFAAVEAGGAQLVYLVLFSYAFFFKGFTGLTITIGAILTLFVAMQLTGRMKWGEAQ